MATIRNKASKDARPRKRFVNDVPPDMDLRLEYKEIIKKSFII